MANKQIGCLGPQNTFTHQAALLFYPDFAFQFCNNISEACQLVEDKILTSAILPLENLINGSVNETLDNLWKRNITFSKLIKMPINQCFISLQDAIFEDIEVIASHPQALMQCSEFIEKYFPKAKKITFASTVQAAEYLLSESPKNTAILASKILADRTGLKLYKEAVQNNPNNFTKFIEVKKGALQEEGNSTSIAFTFNQDSAGNLFEVLGVFNKEKINLTKIQSRPTGLRAGDYVFYLDFEAKPNHPLMKELEKIVSGLKVLGVVR